MKTIQNPEKNKRKRAKSKNRGKKNKKKGMMIFNSAWLIFCNLLINLNIDSTFDELANSLNKSIKGKIKF